MNRHVKGVLFADYVRMIRGQKGVDWAQHLEPEDMPYLDERIQREGWYPMLTFERMGNAILTEIVRTDDRSAVRAWGRFSVDRLCQQYPGLLAEGDAVETLHRFRVLRSTFFDYECLAILSLFEGEAELLIHYHMGARAEEAASYQTLGFFERLLEIAARTTVTAELTERSWDGDSRTVLDLRW